VLFALTDVAAGRFYAFERTSRAALELAGATARPFPSGCSTGKSTGNHWW
jgi:hypothetical protein